MNPEPFVIGRIFTGLLLLAETKSFTLPFLPFLGTVYSRSSSFLLRTVFSFFDVTFQIIAAFPQSFSIALSLAQDARGFTLSSASSLTIGFLVSTLEVGFLPQVHTGAWGSQMHGCS